jgi:hypothetical protein
LYRVMRTTHTQKSGARIDKGEARRGAEKTVGSAKVEYNIKDLREKKCVTVTFFFPLRSL